VILSDARAKAVLQALVKRGIEAARLSSKGYGPDKPLDPAQNEAAWSKNRRVQFVVLQKDASNTEVKTK
jgi:outer membrane protein OmpA-like peptidoglycan-associated protein